MPCLAYPGKACLASIGELFLLFWKSKGILACTYPEEGLLNNQTSAALDRQGYTVKNNRSKQTLYLLLVPRRGACRSGGVPLAAASGPAHMIRGEPEKDSPCGGGHATPRPTGASGRERRRRHLWPLGGGLLLLCSARRGAGAILSIQERLFVLTRLSPIVV